MASDYFDILRSMEPSAELSAAMGAAETARGFEQRSHVIKEAGQSLRDFARDAATVTATEPTPAPPTERWLHDESEFTGHVQFPFLDEFIAKNVDIHFETMSETQFWMSIRCRETGQEWHLNCGAINSRARGYSIVERTDV